VQALHVDCVNQLLLATMLVRGMFKAVRDVSDKAIKLSALSGYVYGWVDQGQFTADAELAT
jgi:hypothetical protein